jgi:hypothetical protein
MGHAARWRPFAGHLNVPGGASRGHAGRPVGAGRGWPDRPVQGSVVVTSWTTPRSSAWRGCWAPPAGGAVRERRGRPGARSRRRLVARVGRVVHRRSSRRRGAAGAACRRPGTTRTYVRIRRQRARGTSAPVEAGASPVGAGGAGAGPAPAAVRAPPPERPGSRTAVSGDPTPCAARRDRRYPGGSPTLRRSPTGRSGCIPPGAGAAATGREVPGMRRDEGGHAGAEERPPATDRRRPPAPTAARASGGIHEQSRGGERTTPAAGSPSARSGRVVVGDAGASRRRRWPETVGRGGRSGPACGRRRG